MELSILNLFLVLFVAWIGGQLAVRLGYPSVLGELLAGIIFGPPLLGILFGSDAINVLAELGVIMMMLYIGMEIDPRELGKASKGGVLAALGGFIVPFALGLWIVVASGGTTIAGVFVGMAMGVTSLATKSRILVDLKILDTRIAYVMLAGALVADTLSLVIFAGILSFATVGKLDLLMISTIAVKILLFFFVSWLLGLKVFPFLYKWLKQRNITGRTFNATLILLIALAFAELAHLAELHSILGAFIAGLVLREAITVKKLSHELTDLVKDVSLGFLAPIFFVTAGFQVSLEVIRTDTTLLIGTIVLATVGKVVGTTLFYLPSGYGWREGLTIGAGMNGRGAVEIVIAGIGLNAGIISQEIFSILVFMAIITTATVPVLLKIGVEWLDKRNELVRSTIGKEDIVIVGAGSLARLFAKALVSKRPITMIDSNETNCKKAAEMGLKANYGDALDDIILRDAGIDSTGTLISMTPNAEVNVLIAKRSYEEFLVPQIFAAIIDEREKGLIKQLETVGGKLLFDRKVNILEWENMINNDQIILEQIKIESGSKNELEKKIPTDTLPMIIVRENKKYVYDGFESVNKGDLIFTLFRKPDPNTK
ncbi:MAG TPA: sodium:proton exchanger [Ignavibacteria bacterium]|nr:sodium:proton exchanger [Ignavibacteria bacterium]